MKTLMFALSTIVLAACFQNDIEPSPDAGAAVADAEMVAVDRADPELLSDAPPPSCTSVPGCIEPGGNPVCCAGICTRPADCPVEDVWCFADENCGTHDGVTYYCCDDGRCAPTCD